MAFHQLEKVLARAATNRSFRDELTTGDADLDELGLSDDEQSVLTELVASSGAGLDAVLNIVTAIPATAAATPHPTVPGAGQNIGAGAPGHNGMPQNSTPVATPATTTPAFALMTPTMMATPATVTPGAMTTAPVAAPPMQAPMAAVQSMASGLAGMQPMQPMQPMPTAAGMQPMQPMQPMPTAAGMQPMQPMQAMPPMQAMDQLQAAQHLQPTQHSQPMQAPPTHYGVPYTQQGGPNPTVTAGPNPPAVSPGSAANNGPHRSLDAADVGRPVVARLPFGMDVVK